MLRRRALRGEVAAADAESLLQAGEPLIDHRHRMTGELARAAWGLRAIVSFYDALYVALAAALRIPLVTADLRLSAAPRLGCAVERVGGI